MKKSSKQRECPALGRAIGRAECGAGRQSRIACPATCEHNPFTAANHTALLEAEDRLNMRTIAALAAEIGEAAVDRILAACRQAGDETDSEGALLRALFVVRDQEGLSFAER